MILEGHVKARLRETIWGIKTRSKTILSRLYAHNDVSAAHCFEGGGGRECVRG